VLIKRPEAEFFINAFMAGIQKERWRCIKSIEENASLEYSAFLFYWLARLSVLRRFDFVLQLQKNTTRRN
jgi:hypothetical protein